MLCANATELFIAMKSAVDSEAAERTTSDGPQASLTLEAKPGCSFVLRSPDHNVPACKSVDLRWAAVNTLHFFAATEDASTLLQYNEHARRFLTGDRWLGAYGVKAVPQLELCVRKLKADPHSRRAIVNMEGLENEDINRPHCWSCLHFLTYRGRLDMLVYQRSLNLFGVMPYDCVVLTNVHRHVAHSAGVPVGNLRWTVGSLHYPAGQTVDNAPRQRNLGVLVPYDVMASPTECLRLLRDGVEGSRT